MSKINFEEWHKDNLVKFLEFFKGNFPKNFEETYDAYNAYMRGD